MRQGEAGGANS